MSAVEPSISTLSSIRLLGWEIGDSDGTACGGEVCQNEGTCSLDDSAVHGFSCDCKMPYGGDQCEVHSDCAGPHGCQNGGECRVTEETVECDCPLGFKGERCHEREFSICVQKMPLIQAHSI